MYYMNMRAGAVMLDCLPSSFDLACLKVTIDQLHAGFVI